MSTTHLRPSWLLALLQLELLLFLPLLPQSLLTLHLHRVRGGAAGREGSHLSSFLPGLCFSGLPCSRLTLRRLLHLYTVLLLLHHRGGGRSRGSSLRWSSRKSLGWLLLPPAWSTSQGPLCLCLLLQRFLLSQASGPHLQGQTVSGIFSSFLCFHKI